MSSQPQLLVKTLSDNHTALKMRIQTIAEKCGRKQDKIQLIAVSKLQSIEKIETLYHLGHSHFGENYVDELIEKATALTNLKIHWSFIGRLQSNKIKDLLQSPQISKPWRVSETRTNDCTNCEI